MKRQKEKLADMLQFYAKLYDRAVDEKNYDKMSTRIFQISAVLDTALSVGIISSSEYHELCTIKRNVFYGKNGDSSSR